MAERAARNSWVEICCVVLPPAARAPQVPADTHRVALEMKVKGFLQREASLGEEVEIITVAGRVLSGTLSAINPAYTHTFGAPLAELLSIGAEVRAMLDKNRRKP